MDDVRAVMEAVHSEQAVVFGMSEGGNMAMLFAATYPERTIALITFGVFACRVYNPDYPWAPTPEARQNFYDAIENEWGGPVGIEDLAPSLAGDELFRQWWATYLRRSASPHGALRLAQLNTSIDIRHVLPAIQVPTLVLHRIDDRDCNIEEGRYIAARIPHAKLVELPGEDHLIFTDEQETIFREVETFLADVHHRSQDDSVLATVLTINSTSDRITEKRESSSSLHARARREAEWFKGRVVSVDQAYFCAIFDGPIRAIRCARAIRDRAAEMGIAIRIGLHTGLVEISSHHISGKAVNISNAVSARAATGQILITNTVMDLVSGADLKVVTCGECHLEELAADFTLYELV